MSATSNVQGDRTGTVIPQPNQEAVKDTRMNSIVATLLLLGGGVMIGLSIAGFIDYQWALLVGAALAGAGGFMIASKDDWKFDRKFAFICGTVLFAAGVATLGVGIHEAAWGSVGVGGFCILLALMAAHLYRKEKEQQDRQVQGRSYQALPSRGR